MDSIRTNAILGLTVRRTPSLHLKPGPSSPPQEAGRVRVHAAFAPVCLGGEVHWVSARARVLPPGALVDIPAGGAVGDGGDGGIIGIDGVGPDEIRRAVERSAARYGPCGPGCSYALLAAPAALCPACAVPAGGGTALLTGRENRGWAGAGGDEVELAAWDGAEWAGAGPGPAALRLDAAGLCWARRECPVALVVEDAGGAERRRQISLLLLEWDG